MNLGQIGVKPKHFNCNVDMPFKSKDDRRDSSVRISRRIPVYFAFNTVVATILPTKACHCRETDRGRVEKEKAWYCSPCFVAVGFQSIVHVFACVPFELAHHFLCYRASRTRHSSRSRRRFRCLYEVDMCHWWPTLIYHDVGSQCTPSKVASARLLTHSDADARYLIGAQSGLYRLVDCFTLREQLPTHTLVRTEELIDSAPMEHQTKDLFSFPRTKSDIDPKRHFSIVIQA